MWIEVQKIIHLQSIVTQLLDAFTNNKKRNKITFIGNKRSNKVSEGQLINTIANESKTHLKCRRPIVVKDTVPPKKRLRELNKKIGAPKGSTKQKKTIEMGTSEEYI